MAEKEIKRWITVNGQHIPIYDDDIQNNFLEGLAEGDSLDAYLNDGLGVKKSDVSEADEKKFKNGEWDIAESSFSDDISYVKNFEIEKAFRDSVGDAPKAPTGAVNSKTQALAKNSLDWYAKNASESTSAANKYRSKMNDFSSKGAKKLCYLRAKWFEENAAGAKGQADWFKRAYSKYL